MKTIAVPNRWSAIFQEISEAEFAKLKDDALDLYRRGQKRSDVSRMLVENRWAPDFAKWYSTLLDVHGKELEIVESRDSRVNTIDSGPLDRAAGAILSVWSLLQMFGSNNSAASGPSLAYLIGILGLGAGYMLLSQRRGGVWLALLYSLPLALLLSGYALKEPTALVSSVPYWLIVGYCLYRVVTRGAIRTAKQPS